MEWYELYRNDNQPTMSQIDEFVNNSLWKDINSFLQKTWHVDPKMAYSKCSMQSGWNVKYHKGGKSLCTLYPMSGFFIALVVIGERERAEAEMMMPLCCGYTRNLFANTRFSTDGKWLMMVVTDEPILEDVKHLIMIRKKAST